MNHSPIRPVTRRARGRATAWLLAVAFLCGSAAPALGQAGETNALPAGVMATVLEIRRPTQHDSVFLAGGETMAGNILNRAIQIHTACGSVSIAARFIAAISFNDPDQHFDAVFTVNRNRLTGFIHDAIQIETAPGTTISVPKPRLHRLLFRVRPAEAEDARSGQFVILENGDALSGRFRLPEVLIDTRSASHALAEKVIDSLRFERGSVQVHVQHTSGLEENGRVPAEDLKIQLDIGPELVLPRERWSFISTRVGFVPVEARRFSSERAPGQAGSLPPAGAVAPPEMIWIPAGTFLLGSPSSERGRGPDEDPQTEVAITRGFWIGRHEVTQGEFLAVMGNNPSNFQSDTNRPVERVTWHEANEYCARLTARARAAGRMPARYVYRLPTEAEWEYACRAGTTTRFSYGDDPTETGLAEFGWFSSNANWSTHPVGQLQASPWGLYDMHGNVWEWCRDLWGSSYPGARVPDYAGPAEGRLRVARGGSWLYGAAFSRSANRDDYGADNRCSDIGFRVVLAPEL